MVDDDVVVTRAVGGVALGRRFEFQVDGERLIPHLIP